MGVITNIIHNPIFSQIMFCFVICGAKIVEISIQSVKTVSMIKGRRVLASILAFIECLLWGLVVSSVISDLSNNILWLISYCLGYASGLFIGSKIEEMIALGTSSMQIIVNESHIEAVENYLQDNNKGYTVIEGHGAKEKSFVVIIVLPRKEVKNTMAKIAEICDNKVFLITADVGKFAGGYGIVK